MNWFISLTSLMYFISCSSHYLPENDKDKAEVEAENNGGI